ncbi:MAG: FG-GAP-like repeat-containing protein [Myxococcota bacterium]
MMTNKTLEITALSLAASLVAACTQPDVDEHEPDTASLSEELGDEPEMLDETVEVAVTWTRHDRSRELPADVIGTIPDVPAADTERRLAAETLDVPRIANLAAAGGFTLPGDDPVVASWSGVGNDWNDAFGRSVAIGDFNDDGIDDYAIGAPFEVVGGNRARGAVYVWHGNQDGTATPAERLFDPYASSNEYLHFGWSLAVGDFDDDGHDDLAISSPYDRRGAGSRGGSVTIYHGTSQSFSYEGELDQESMNLDVNERGDRFGWSMAAGDFDGDGDDDLAIGAPGETVGTLASGAVYVALANSSGELVGYTAIRQSDQGSLGSPEGHERFGAAVASGGRLYPGTEPTNAETLVVGCFNDVVNGRRVGAAYTYSMIGSGFQPQDRLTQNGSQEEGDDFGWSLAIGDFDADGNDDLAVGAPGENRDTGWVWVWEGDGNDIHYGYNFGGTGLGYLPGARFGHALGAGELTGGGGTDLVIGAPGTAWLEEPWTGFGVQPDVGAIAYAYGLPGIGAQYLGNYVRQLDGWTRQSGERYGVSVAVGESSGVVLAGSPFETVDGTERVGSAQIWRWVANPPLAPAVQPQFELVQE